MGFLKGYLKPAPADTTPTSNATTKPSIFKKSKSVPAPIELAVTPPLGSPALGSPAGTLRNAQLSRPSSLYPEGDFRNSARDTILDIKSDVMVAWLNQAQLEKLWGNNLHNEGVVLKKARDSFTCSPATLRDDQGGLFDQVMAMNVRVSHVISLRYTKLTMCTVCNDHQYPDHQDLPFRTPHRLRATL